MINHFESLWEECEKLFSKDSLDSKDIMNECLTTLQLLKASIDNPTEQNKKIKALLLGELLFNFTKFSLKEDIDVYQALKEAFLIRIKPYHQ